MKKLTITATVAFALALIGGTEAYALSITPSSGVLNTTRWEGDETGQAQIDTAIAGILGSAVELYKQNVGDASDTGTLAASYETVFANTPTDPAEATITYVGGNVVGPTAYLLVKDGNQEPAWYLFNLTALGWTGVQPLELTGFWPNGGAISHVTLYGTSQPPTNEDVPEPATLVLMGLSLLGAGMMRRRRA